MRVFKDGDADEFVGRDTVVQPVCSLIEEQIPALILSIAWLSLEDLLSHWIFLFAGCCVPNELLMAVANITCGVAN